MGLKYNTKTSGIKQSLITQLIVYLVLFAALIFWLQAVHLARAAGGVFTIEVTPTQTSYASGSEVTFEIDYSCNGATSTDTCDDVVITMPRPSGLNTNGAISGSGQTVSHNFSSSTGVWQFIPSIPSGSTGKVSVSWIVPNYSTPDGTVISGTAQVRVGTPSGPIVGTDTNTTSVSAEAQWLTVKQPNTTNPILIGQNYTYTVGVYYNPSAANLGRLNIENLIYTDTLPANATYVSSTDGGVYDAGTHTVSWPATLTSASQLSSGGHSASGTATNPVVTRKVTVRYDAPLNQNGDSVTNIVNWTASGRGTPSDTQTGTANRTNLLSSNVVFGSVISKTPDTGSYSPGASVSWSTTIYNRSNTTVSGTARDVLPCVDDVSAAYYESGTDPSAACTSPSNTVTNVSFSTTSNATVSSIRWWTNTGNSGTYTPAIPLASSITTSTMGIPAAQKLTAIEFDYEIGANPTPATSTTDAAFVFYLLGNLDPSLNSGDMVRNVASFTMTNGTNTASGSDHGTININDPLPYITTTVVDAAGAGVVYRPTEQITWNATYTNSQASGNYSLVQPDWYIAVPVGLRYVPGSVEFTNLPASIGQPEIVESYPGGTNLTGYTILHLRWPDGTEMPYSGLTATRQIGIRFKTMVEPSMVSGTYTGTPPANAAAPTTASRGIYSAAYAVGRTSLYAGSTDTYDFNENNITSENYATANSQWRVGLSASAFGDILVQGSEDSAYSYLGQTQAGQSGRYRINLQNASNDGSILTDFVFYATLPREGDEYVSQNYAGQSRGSDTTVTITGPVTAPANVNIFYSLSTNPCRNEVYPDSANTGCVDDWVSAASITDWSQVRALKFTMSDHYDEGEGELVTIPVKMDDGAQRGDIAWMSIAYQARNVTNGITLLPAEAPRVGLEVIGGSLGIAKSASPASGQAVRAGDTVTYTVTTRNNGDLPLTNVTVTDNLSDVFDDATLVPGSLSVSGVTGAPMPTITGNTLNWVGDLDVGDALVITYQVTVDADGVGGVLNNHVEAEGEVDDDTSVTGHCTVTSEDFCETTHQTAGYSVAKTATPVSGTEVNQGDTITYSITVRNPGTAPITTAQISDNLTDVLDNSAFNNASRTATSSVAGNTPSLPVRSGSTLTWSGPLAAGETVTLTYSVTVNNDAYNVTLRNAVTGSATAVVTGVPTTLPSGCATGLEVGCYTIHTTDAATASYTTTKSASVPSGSTVDQNSTITYTITTRNTGELPIEAQVTDTMTNVLTHADMVAGSIGTTSSVSGNTPPNATLTGTNLSWSGTLAPNETVTIQYTVRIHGTAFAVTLQNAVTTTAETTSGDPVAGGCVLGTQTGCFTTHTTDQANNSYGVQKTSMPISGTAVDQGDTIIYSIEVRNTGEQPINPATITDNLSQVLLYADIVPFSLVAESSIGANTPAAPTVNGTQLNWSGTLAVGEVVTISYQVIVHDDAWDVTIVNSVTGTAQSPTGPLTGNCITGAEANCRTTHATDSPVRSYAARKVSNPAHNATVKQGDTITYMITLENTGEVPIEATLNDDISALLRAADIVEGSLAIVSSRDSSTPAMPTITGATLSWQGELTAREVITITYDATVKADAYDTSFRNAITTTAGDPNDPTTVVAGGCSITEASCYTDLVTDVKPIKAPDSGAGDVTSLKTMGAALLLVIVGAVVMTLRRSHRLS